MANTTDYVGTLFDNSESNPNKIHCRLYYGRCGTEKKAILLLSYSWWMRCIWQNQMR